MHKAERKHVLGNCVLCQVGRVVKLVHMTNVVRLDGAVPQVDVATRIYMSRMYAGLEISELSEVAGVSRNTITNYERGRTVPRRSALLAIALATGVDLSWLETGKTPAWPGPGGGNRNIDLCAIRDSNPEPTDLRLLVSQAA